jgi:hypothetical protein
VAPRPRPRRRPQRQTGSLNELPPHVLVLRPAARPRHGNGARARTGDLLGSGTVSGPDPAARGSLMEMTWRGRDPLTLRDGTTRTFPRGR